MKRDSSEKTTWCQSACQTLCSCAHCRRSCQYFAVRGILYNDTLIRSPRCSRCRHINKADISTPVTVDQRAANCLEEAVRLFIALQNRFRSLMMSLSVFHCQFFELFGARQSTATKLASLWNCSAAHELLLRDRKILLLAGR